MNIQTLLDAIDRLPEGDLEQLQRRIERRQRELQSPELDHTNLKAKVAAMDEAIEAFRAGLTEAELSELLAAMSTKRKSSADLQTFAWIDDLPEDER